jgi:organic radical activating enzyme
MSHLEVLDELNELWPIDEEPTIIVISGGEPMMQQEELILLVNNLRAMQHEVHIETAGTIAPTQEMLELVTQFNVSPKLGSSGNVLTKRYKPEVLRTLVACNGTYYSARAYFKFVVVSLNDFTEIDHIVTNLDIPLNRIQVMPEGTTSLGQIKHGREIVDAALVRGYGLSFRTHTLLWGNERGK